MPAGWRSKVDAGGNVGLPELSVTCFILTCLAHELIRTIVFYDPMHTINNILVSLGTSKAG